MDEVKLLLTDIVKEKYIADIILDYKQQFENLKKCCICKKLRLLYCYSCSFTYNKDICLKCCYVVKLED